MKGGHSQQRHINWGAFNHASHAPQLMSCNYYMYVTVFTHVHVCTYFWTHIHNVLLTKVQSIFLHCWGWFWRSGFCSSREVLVLDLLWLRALDRERRGDGCWLGWSRTPSPSPSSSSTWDKPSNTLTYYVHVHVCKLVKPCLHIANRFKMIRISSAYTHGSWAHS